MFLSFVSQFFGLVRSWETWCLRKKWQVRGWSCPSPVWQAIPCSISCSAWCCKFMPITNLEWRKVTCRLLVLRELTMLPLHQELFLALRFLVSFVYKKWAVIGQWFPKIAVKQFKMLGNYHSAKTRHSFLLDSKKCLPLEVSNEIIFLMKWYP